MSKLIEAKQAKEFAQSFFADPVLRMAVNAVVDQCPGFAMPQKWIPVTERMPELIPCDAGTAYSEAVNVLTSGHKVLTAIWNGDDFITDAEFWEADGEEITHWTPVPLPLPKPPKEI